MIRVARAYLACLRAEIGVMFQYRAEILLWSVWGLVNPAVLYAMWSAASESGTNAAIAGFTRGDFAAYYFVMMIVGHMATAWDVYEMGYLVRTGKLSPLLLRPLMPIWKSLAANTAYKISTFVFIVPMWVLFAYLVTPTFHTSAWQLALGSVALALAAALNFFLGYLVSLCAFWLTKMDAVSEIYFAAGMYLGGRLAPLDALPGPIHWLALSMPFRWIFAFPTELLMGRVSGVPSALAGILAQAAWLTLCLVALRFFWIAAVKRYTAVSG